VMKWVLNVSAYLHAAFAWCALADQRLWLD
jgi:hypothetical protein